MERNFNRYVENIDFGAIKSLDQSNTFTYAHTRYKVCLTNLTNGKKVCFEYQCNPKYNKPSKTNCLWAYLMDAQSYYYSDDDLDAFAADLYSDDDLDAFAADLDIQKPSEVFRVFNACKKAYNDLVDFFGSEGTLHSYMEAFQEY